MIAVESTRNIKLQRCVVILSIGLLIIKVLAYFITHPIAILTEPWRAL
jgi:hypothetical protein